MPNRGDADSRVGRNDPCPCGSGRKYKNCCMRKDLAAAPAGTPHQAVPGQPQSSGQHHTRKKKRR